MNRREEEDKAIVKAEEAEAEEVIECEAVVCGEKVYTRCADMFKAGGRAKSMDEVVVEQMSKWYEGQVREGFLFGNKPKPPEDPWFGATPLRGKYRFR